MLIHSKCNHFQLLTPDSLSIPLPPPPSWQPNFCSLSTNKPFHRKEIHEENNISFRMGLVLLYSFSFCLLLVRFVNCLSHDRNSSIPFYFCSPSGTPIMNRLAHCYLSHTPYIAFMFCFVFSFGFLSAVLIGKFLLFYPLFYLPITCLFLCIFHYALQCFYLSLHLCKLIFKFFFLPLYIF